MKSTLTPPSRASAKSEKLASRLAHILAQLHQGDVLDKHQLADKFGVDVRTIERDLGERLAGIVERGASGQWQLSHTARGSIPARKLNDYAQLAGTQNLLPDRSLPYLLEQLEAGPSRNGLHVLPVSREDLGPHSQPFKQLQAAIEARHECRFTYKDKPRHVHPYKLIERQGVWYLSAAEADTNTLKNFAFTRIQHLNVGAVCFAPDPDHIDYIGQQQDVWFNTTPTDVTLRVAPEVAHYFARRALLPEQRNNPQDNGDLIVHARVNHLLQVLPLVRYWLPHVRIIEPKAWNEELIHSLWQAMDALVPATLAQATQPSDNA